MPARLFALSYSPWSERARWALDHHGLEYRYHEHLPFLGEPVLRFLARKSGRDKASVPLFTDKDTSIGDSIEIMKHAEAVGGGSPLFAELEACDEIAALCEVALQAARARVVIRTLASRQALNESAQAAAPAFAAPLLRPVARLGARFLAKKYGANTDDADARNREMAGVLEALHTRRKGQDYYLGTFSAADIFVTGVVQAIAPVDAAHIKLLPAVRACWADAGLASRFSEMVDWRDRIYARHRSVSPT